MRSLCFMCSSLVAKNVCSRGRAAVRTPSHASFKSSTFARAKAQIIGGSARPSAACCPTSDAMPRTAFKSSGDAAGKPASMTSTPTRDNMRATSSFCAAVMVAPGACSPSRKVVSKMRTCASPKLDELIDELRALQLLLRRYWRCCPFA